MSFDLKDNRWQVESDEFAVRVQVPDLQEFFFGIPKGRSLVIEPGTRAIVIDAGTLVGEVPPGEYVLESFLERLELFSKKQATIVLTRSEEVTVSYSLRNVVTADSVCIDLDVRFSLQISDLVSFLHNFLGPRNDLSISDLQQMLDAVFRHAICDGIGTLGVDEILQPNLSSRLEAIVQSRLDVRLTRYGFALMSVQSAECKSEALSELRKQDGANWLAARENGLLEAANAVSTERLQIKLKEAREKVPVRREYRDALNSDRMDEIRSKDELAEFLKNIDKDRKLHDHEREMLVASFADEKQDAQAARRHVLSRLEIEREKELDELRIEVAHAIEVKSLEQETELAKISSEKESAEWLRNLEKEKQALAHRHEVRLEKIQSRWVAIRESNREKRDESWRSILHQQKTDDLKGQIEVSRVERTARIAVMESELNTRLDREKLDREKRRTEWDLDVNRQRSTDQLDRLARVQQMNTDFTERQQRLQAELSKLKDDNESDRELKRIEAMSALSTEALIATADTKNAETLADLKKTEANAAAAQTSDEERQKLYERLNETEQGKADAIAEAYKTAMLSQQGNVQQMISGISQIANPGAVTNPLVSESPPALPVAWHVAIDGQQVGPLSVAEIEQHIQAGRVNSQSLVWRKGLPEWTSASRVTELSQLFAAIPPPLQTEEG